MKVNQYIPACPVSSLEPAFAPAAPWLAPLAGYSDLPFRLLCRSYGAAVCETEMISAKGLLYGNAATTDLLASVIQDQPLIVQLFGGESAPMAQALRILLAHGFRWFDCNMGCPVRKVMRQKAGAALMADLSLAREIARAMLAAASESEFDSQAAKVGFKLRLPPGGIAELVDFGRQLEDLGASWLTLHPRTAAQGFGGQADWQAIARLAEAVSIPVIASGDLFTAADGVKCLELTGVPTVMYGRGALHNPSVFAQHLELLQGREPNPLSRRQLVKTVLEHISLTRRYGNPRNAFKKMRSIIPRYAKHLPGVARLRVSVCQCQNWEELAECVGNLLDEKFPLPADKPENAAACSCSDMLYHNEANEDLVYES